MNTHSGSDDYGGRCLGVDRLAVGFGIHMKDNGRRVGRERISPYRECIRIVTWNSRREVKSDYGACAH
jgi:hypothetical protein